MGRPMPWLVTAMLVLGACGGDDETSPTASTDTRPAAAAETSTSLPAPDDTTAPAAVTSASPTTLRPAATTASTTPPTSVTATAAPTTAPPTTVPARPEYLTIDTGSGTLTADLASRADAVLGTTGDTADLYDEHVMGPTMPIVTNGRLVTFSTSWHYNPKFDYTDSSSSAMFLVNGTDVVAVRDSVAAVITALGEHSYSPEPETSTLEDGSTMAEVGMDVTTADGGNTYYSVEVRPSEPGTVLLTVTDTLTFDGNLLPPVPDVAANDPFGARLLTGASAGTLVTWSLSRGTDALLGDATFSMQLDVLAPAGVDEAQLVTALCAASAFEVTTGDDGSVECADPARIGLYQVAYWDGYTDTETADTPIVTASGYTLIGYSG